MKRILPLITAIFTSVGTVSANREMPMSKAEMLQNASEVAVGEVIEVRTVKVTTQQEIEYKETEATFKVTDPIKGSPKVDELWTLRYQIVDSPRFTGDRVPQFKQGDKLTVYVRRSQKDGEGKLVVYLTSSNDVQLIEDAKKKE